MDTSDKRRFLLMVEHVFFRLSGVRTGVKSLRSVSSVFVHASMFCNWLIWQQTRISVLQVRGGCVKRRGDDEDVLR
jgi:hypothetical protein